MNYHLHAARRARLLILTLGLIAAGAPAAIAQPPAAALDNAGGTRYIIAFPDSVGNKLDPKYPNTRVRGEARAMIFSAVNNSVKIMGNGATETRTISAGTFMSVEISPWPVADRINTATTAGVVTISAAYPVVVYCYFATIQGLEAWTPLPVDAWGRRYFAASVAGDVVKDVTKVNTADIEHTAKAAPAEILVIAAQDSTQVTFAPHGGVILAGNPSYTVMLNAGQSYQVQSVVDISDTAYAQQDIAGTTITSSKPIGVVSGNTRSSGTDAMDEMGVLNNIYKNMLIESLTPVDMHGRDFVFMGTWDSHRAGIGSAAERKREYVRAYNTAGRASSGYYFQQGGATKVPFNVKADTIHEIAFGSPTAAFIHMNDPAQVMMSSSSIVQFAGSTPCGAIPCVVFNGWAPYMVDLAPRERWTSFAPYFVPPNPGGMLHYINVVTDTLSMAKILREDGSPFLFNRRIPGTDLIWGSMSLTPGNSGWLTGKDGARFWGFVYGLLQGTEDWGPGRYEEYGAVSYGYPLVASKNAVGTIDSARIDTALGCPGRMSVTANLINAAPAGFRSATLDSGSFNARLVGVTPSDLNAINGMTSIVVRVEPIDAKQPASGTVTITDRTGKTWVIPYTYVPELPAISPATRVDFGEVSPIIVFHRTVVLRNPLDHPISITKIGLQRNNQGYVIASTTPSGPAETPARAVTIAAGDSMTVQIELRPTDDAGVINDTLLVDAGCVTVPLPLIARFGAPVMNLGGLDFGTLRRDAAPKTLKLAVCNVGAGLLSFGGPDGGQVATWDDADFTIDPVSLGHLGTVRLGAGQCDTVEVTFTPRSTGTHQTVAHFWTNATSIRDSSTWTAVVADTALAVPGSPETANGLHAAASGGAAIIRYTLGARSGVRIEIFDGAGRTIATLVDNDAGAGTHALIWDGAGQPSGVYYCRMTAGSWSRTVPIVLAR